MKLKQMSGTIGTAAQHDVGTAANNVIQLVAGGKLPAVDGSQLDPAPTVSSASESSSNIPKYNLIDIPHANTITITSSSPATLASMNVYLIQMTVNVTLTSVYLPPASGLNDGEYIVIVHKSNSTDAGRARYMRVYTSGSDSLFTRDNQAYYQTRRTGSTGFVSNGVDTWYQGFGLGLS